jgi:hypothetical protein
MRVNENTLARTISEREGKKQEVSIAQVKEVLRITLEELARLPASVAMTLIEKHAGAKDEFKAMTDNTFIAGKVRVGKPRDMVVGRE